MRRIPRLFNNAAIPGESGVCGRVSAAILGGALACLVALAAHGADLDDAPGAPLSGMARASEPSLPPAAHVEAGTYVPGEIIVKLKEAAAAEVRTAVSAGRSRLDAFPGSARALNERFGVTEARQLFSGNEKQRLELSEPQRGKRLPATERETRLLRRLQRAADAAPAPDLSGVYKLRLDLPPGVALDAVVEAYRRDPNVAYAQPNYLVRLAATPNDPHFGKQWALHNTGQTYPYSGNYNTPPGTADADIDAVEAWDTQTGSTDVVVAVIDTGTDYTHRDLAANMWVNAQESGGTPGVDDDGNGYVDDVYGYDFCSYLQARDSDPADVHGHGTHCAGIVAAVGNNGLDIAGTAWNARIMSPKYINSNGEGTTEDAAEAIEYAVANGADILSMSWGIVGVDAPVLRDAIAYAASQGVLGLASAGNNNYDYLVYPARYPDVLAVGATDSNDAKATFSNYCCWVELSAPGVDILSLRATGTSMGRPYDAYTTTASGTSMSCPYAAGVAALVLSQHPAFTPREVRSVLKMTAEPYVSSEYIGQGRVNAANALSISAAPVVAFLDMDGLLAEQGTVSGTVDIHGTAKGATFASYVLEYGEGPNPDTWTAFHTATSPVDNGTLFAGFNLGPLWSGLWTIRLSVFDTSGRHVEELRYIRVRGAEAAFPRDNDILKPGATLELHCQPPSTDCVISAIAFGLGYTPTEWHTTGLTVDVHPFDDIVGTWDTSFITQNGFYTLRYTFDSPWGPREAFVHSIYFDTRLREGWPRYITRNKVDSSEPSEVAFTTADLEGDGLTEVLALQEGESWTDREPVLWAFNHDGSVRWSRALDRYPMAADKYCYPYTSLPVAGDVDNDGYMEIFVDVGNPGDGTNHNFPMYGIRYDGSDMAGHWPLDLPLGQSEKALADVNRDGFLELVVRTRANGQAPGGLWVNHVYIIDRQGTLLRTINVPSSGEGYSDRFAELAIGNFDGDTELEIATRYAERTQTGQLAREYPAIYNPNGSFVTGWPVVSDSEGVFSLVAGDLNGDGVDELVVAQVRDAETGEDGGFYAYDAAGHVLPGWPVRPEFDWNDYDDHGLALADLDRDGDLEVCITFRNTVQLYDGAGQLLPGWPKTLNEWCSFNGCPLLVDINGDHALDVVARAGALQPKGLKGEGWDSSGGIWAWKQDGTPIDLCPDSPALYPLWLELYYTGKPAVADLNGNGLVEIIGTSHNNRAFGDQYVSKNRDTIGVWELQAPYDPNLADWPSWQGGSAGSGRYIRPDRISVSALSIHGPATVDEGATVPFTCVATYGNGNVRNVSANAAWSANSGAVAINATGALTAGSVASDTPVVITVSYAGHTQTYPVIVRNLGVASLAIHGPADVDEGSVASYTCIAANGDGSTRDVTALCTWSENCYRATISSAGVLTADTVGGDMWFTIRAEYEGISVTRGVHIVDWNPDEPAMPLLSYAGACALAMLLFLLGAHRIVRRRQQRPDTP